MFGGQAVPPTGVGVRMMGLSRISMIVIGHDTDAEFFLQQLCCAFCPLAAVRCEVYVDSIAVNV